MSKCWHREAHIAQLWFMTDVYICIELRLGEGTTL